MGVGKGGVLSVQTSPEIVQVVVNSFNFFHQNAEMYYGIENFN
jgi:hypothetical protein